MFANFPSTLVGPMPETGNGDTFGKFMYLEGPFYEIPTSGYYKAKILAVDNAYLNVSSLELGCLEKLKHLDVSWNKL